MRPAQSTKSFKELTDRKGDTEKLIDRAPPLPSQRTRHTEGDVGGEEGARAAKKHKKHKERRKEKGEEEKECEEKMCIEVGTPWKRCSAAAIITMKE